MCQGKVIGVGILRHHTCGTEVARLRTNTCNLHEAVLPFMVASLRLVPDELFGRRRSNVDVMLNGTIHHLFDAIDVVRVSDAD